MKSSSKKLFEVLINEEAALDIKDAASYYENKSNGLGLRFANELKSHLEGLKINPFFQVRYKKCTMFTHEKFSFYNSFYNRGKRKHRQNKSGIPY